jgi:ribosomal protein S24E
MDNKVISIKENKIVEDRVEINFKHNINYFKAHVKGAIRAIINDDVDNIIVLKNNEEFEIKGLTIFKVNFIRDVENCIFAKVKYHADVNS